MLLTLTTLVLLGIGCANKNAEPSTPPAKTSITVAYYHSAQPSKDFCNGQKMDSAGYKNSLTIMRPGSIPAGQPIDQDIQNILNLAVLNTEFANSAYTRIEALTYDRATLTLTMRPAGGWAGSSIFMCAWKPFVEKQLSQMTKEIQKIVWEPQS